MNTGPGKIRFGIDLGGTKIEIVALDEGGEVRYRRRVPTPKHDYGEIVRTLCDLVRSAEAELAIEGTVGIGTPGAVSPKTGRLKNSNTVCLNGQPLVEDLQISLGRPVRLANDANCFALSEAVDGSGADGRVVFGVIIGTGTGGGVVVDRTLIIGANAIAGEWGHNPLPWPRDDERPGASCYCGRAGCIETFLSGGALARDFERHTGRSLSGPELVVEAERGDAEALAALQRYEDRFARALASIINVLDPDVIVLGGGVSNIDRWYHTVPELLPKYVFSDAVDTAIRKAKHGDSSGVRGAAWLWA
jgi:fructokinase